MLYRHMPYQFLAMLHPIAYQFLSISHIRFLPYCTSFFPYMISSTPYQFICALILPIFAFYHILPVHIHILLYPIYDSSHSLPVSTFPLPVSTFPLPVSTFPLPVPLSLASFHFSLTSSPFPYHLPLTSFHLSLASSPFPCQFPFPLPVSIIPFTSFQGFIQDLQFGGGVGGGEELKTFGVYVMGVHKQAPRRGVWGLPPPPPPRIFWFQNRCSHIDSDTVASCHRTYTLIIRKANHRIHGQNILD